MMMSKEVGNNKKFNSLKNYLERMTHGGEFLGEYFVSLCLVIMVTVVVAGVSVRYFSTLPFPWGEELARYMLIYITFIGGALAFKRGQLACVDLMVRKFGTSKLGNRMEFISWVLVTFFNAAFAYWSFKLTLSPTIIQQVSPTLKLPMWCLYGVMPVAFLYMFIVSVKRLFELL